MRNRRLCGYDLNGWRDIAARNWLLRPGEEEEFSDEILSQGGVVGSVVHAGEGAGRRWVGGAEASIAPHGRGGGWGHVGNGDRRRGVRDLIESDAKDVKAVAAALAGLARGADCAVLAINDLPTTTEFLQENLLKSMVEVQSSSRLLVWRPVLVALYAIHRGLAREGQRLGIICHSPAGFALQTLRVRRDHSESAAVLAPERRSSGVPIRSSLGYASLLSRAEQRLAEILPEGTTREFGALSSIARVSLGEHARPELIRRSNGTWQVIDPGRPLPLPDLDLSTADFEQMKDCDMVFFETLTEGVVRKGLYEAIGDLLNSELPQIPISAVAAGALVAARRHASRDTVYFDFLPRISTIVQGQDGAANFDLVSAKETLPAGRLYRSERPARLAVLGGQERFTVYIRKEAERWPRKAVVELGAALKETTPVELFVEQVPAAGRARILMQTAASSRQLSVDWDTAEEIHDEWDAIVQKLATPLPTIPKRLVLPCGSVSWEDDGSVSGLRTLLRKNADKRTVDWDALSGKLVQRVNGEYCISSDGELPTLVSEEDRQRLERLTDRAVQLVREMASGKRTAESGPIKFLTWQFRRCPNAILPILIDAWAPNHPLVGHFATRILLYQGVGRIVSDEAHEKLIIDRIALKPVEEWNWRMETACVAFLLSRSDTAPLLLSRDHVELFGKRVLLEFRESLNSTYTKFNYAPFLLVGLLRWRLKEPRALIASRDPLATGLSLAIDKTLRDLRRRLVGTLAFNRYVPILEAAQSELRGEGTNPDLLLDIYSGARD